MHDESLTWKNVLVIIKKVPSKFLLFNKALVYMKLLPQFQDVWFTFFFFVLVMKPTFEYYYKEAKIVT